MKKPLILISNDDGITAPGIKNLISAISDLGEIYVVAPDGPQSGKGHAISVNDIIVAEEIDLGFDVVKSWQCSGTPADCVKLAKEKLLPRTPDLCLSGINHGSNSSINVIYSGTMSAAIEAGLEGIPSMGFSLLDFSWDADFAYSQVVVRKMVTSFLANKFPKQFIFNVNIPNIPEKDIKGIQFCKQGKGKWKEEYVQRENPFGKIYYWLSGKFVNTDNSDPEMDENALEKGYVSVVPIRVDYTNEIMLKQLKNIEL